MRGRGSSALRVGLVALLCGAALWALFRREYFTPHSLVARLQGLGPSARCWFVLFYALATLILVPGSLLTVAGGMAFGLFWGTLLSLLGATVGATLAFLIARYVTAGWLDKNQRHLVAQVVRGVEKEGWRFVAFIRLVPIFPFNLVNYALGLTRIGMATYVVTSFICMAPGAAAYAYIGYASESLLARKADSIKIAVSAAGLLVALALLPRLVRRFRRERFIHPAELHQRLRDGCDLTVLDVRTVDEYNGSLGHISGSINVPLSELPERIASLQELKNRPVVLVCLTHKRSLKAAEMLEANGFKDVTVLQGGMKAWSEFLIEDPSSVDFNRLDN